MIVFVPVGRDVTLSAMLSGDGVDAITTAQFDLYRVTPQGEQALGTVQGAVRDRKATCTWTASGPTAAESGCSVYYRVTAGDLRAVAPAEIVVFRDRLAVTALKSAGGPPQPGALVALKVTVDPHYTPPSGARSFPRERLLRANDQGVTVFDNLPPGRWELSFRSPFHLVRWTVPTGPAREAVVERLVRGEFVFPDPSGLTNGVHKQWVNLTTDPTAVVALHADHGPVLAVRARVKPDNGPGRTGDRLYMKAVFGTDNSLRNDPAPSFEGTPGGKGVTVPAVSKALTADGGEVVFTVHLGLAGGDAVTLHLGGTPLCEDASITVLNWRKLHIHPVRPRDYALPNDQLPDPVKRLMETHLRRGFIEPEFEGATALPDNGGGYVVPADITRHYPQLPQGVGLLFFSTSPEKALFSANSNAPRFPPRIHLVLGHVIAKKSVETHTFSVTSARSPWRPSSSGLQFYPVPFDGEPLLGEVAAEVPRREKTRRAIVRYTSPSSGEPKPVYGEVGTGEWLDAIPAVGSHVEIAGQRYALPDTAVEISEDKLRYRIQLPRDAARALSSRTPGTVTLRIACYSFLGGSSTGNWLSAVWLGANGNEKGAITLLHEIGHCIGLAPNDGAAYPGLPGTHDETYGLGATTDTEQHGHEGPHCAVGLTTAQKATPRYATLVDSGRHGHCIMFGGTGPKTRINTLKFCDKCLPYLRATRITEV